jgi:hypothetical protein
VKSIGEWATAQQKRNSRQKKRERVKKGEEGLHGVG